MATPTPTPGAPHRGGFRASAYPPFGAAAGPSGASSSNTQPLAEKIAELERAVDATLRILGQGGAETVAAIKHLESKVNLLDKAVKGLETRLDELKDEDAIAALIKRVVALEERTGLGAAGQGGVKDLRQRIAALETAGELKEQERLAERLSTLEAKSNLVKRIGTLEAEYKEAEEKVEQLHALQDRLTALLEEKNQSTPPPSRIASASKSLLTRVRKVGRDHKRTMQTIAIIVGSIALAVIAQKIHSFLT